MFKLWFVKLLLLLSMSGALALNETSEFLHENGQKNDITGDELVPITLPQHQDNAIDTQSCYPDMCGVLTDLGAIQSRLAAAEREIEELKSENKAQMLEIQALKHRLNFTEVALRDHSGKLEELGRGKVAFSASLGGYGHIGPYNVATTIKYMDVLTNLGNAYKPATGIFTAPVRGIYYFSFCYHASQQNTASISLYRNSDLIASTTHHDTNSDSPDNGSNGVALQLAEGDQVYVMLSEKAWVWDGPNRVTVFAGFLVTQL